jgi:predicted DNA-binding transcriptional regulator AlpA
MKTHEFSIIASGLDPSADTFESRFYDAGCEDATVSFQKGHIIVDFAREAASLEDAISSAIEAVASTGAKVERVEPDPLVSLADIASRTGMTRAAMTHYSKGQRGRDFPAPVARVTSDSPLWDWSAVARWLFARKKLAKETVIEAAVMKQANEEIACGQVHVRERLRTHVQEFEATM